MHVRSLFARGIVALCLAGAAWPAAAGGLPGPAAAGTALQQEGGGAAQAPAPDSALAAVDTLMASGAEDYIARVREEFTAENRRYADTRMWLMLIDPVYAVLVGLVVLFSGLAARMRDLARRVTRSGYVHMLVFLALYTVVVAVLTLPLSWYGGFALEHRYGLSNQTLSAWAIEQLKSAGVAVLLLGVIPIAWLAYGAIRRRRHWWAWLGAGTLPVIVFAVLIQPVLIDPMFNEFKPLEDKVLEARVLELAERTGIPGRNVYQVDKSEQTKKLNAYVNGFGVSQRVVFWDTIIAAMGHDELAVVAAHEMGHYVLGHVWKTLVFLSALSFLLFFLTAKAMGWLIRRFGARWGFTEAGDLASLPLFAMVLTVVAFVAQPVFNAYSRYQEHEADTFALEVTRLNDAGATTFLKLGAQNRANPEPSLVQKWLLWTHPPLIERVRFMQSYRPWEEGKPNRAFRGDPPS